MILIEKENTTLSGVLDKRYARPEIDKRRLGKLIDLISTIRLYENGEKDLLGRVYEYFLGQFASSEGKNGGEFYTPTSIVKTLVEMIEPFEGIIYNPAVVLVECLFKVKSLLRNIKEEWITFQFMIKSLTQQHRNFVK